MSAAQPVLLRNNFRLSFSLLAQRSYFTRDLESEILGLIALFWKLTEPSSPRCRHGLTSLEEFAPLSS